MIQTVLIDIFMIGMLIFSIFMLIFVSFGLTFVFGAPWVPSRKLNIRMMLELADIKVGDRVTDLGAGDGRLLVMAVKEFKAGEGIGHEIHPGLIVYGRIRAFFSGVSKQIKFKQGNVFNLPIEKTDVVVLYLLGPMMMKLIPKLKKDLDPNTKIVSNGFRFEGVKHEKSLDAGGTKVFLYRVRDL